MQQMFLLGLFRRLRQADFPLGLDDYLLALKAIEGGFGLHDETALYRLCRALWVKSEKQEHYFEHIFKQYLQDIPSFSEHSISSEHEEENLLSQSEQPKEIKPDMPAPETSSLASKDVETEQAFDFNQAMQVAQVAVERTLHKQSGRLRFMLKPTNLPVTLRQMKRTWHYLRRFSRTGPLVELDIEATLHRIGQEGLFLKPVLRPKRTNQARVVLLLDQEGSMVPFHLFGQQLVYSAQRGGRLRKADVYYFHNVPLRHLYRDQARLGSIPIDRVLSQFSTDTAVLIFSDAGAARRNYNIDRILQTEQFLEALGRQVRRYVWLNPVPNERWPGTSAAEIARLVPMFELSRPSLDAAISALRGQGHYWEKIYEWMI